MFRPRIVTRVPAALGRPRTGPQTDRAMDVLQYGMAALALAVVVVLAVVR